MQNLPLVSICIPVYNGANYIDETINCCINQSYKNIEVIVSDNCSTDNTVELIKKYNIINECHKKAEHFINLASNSLTVFKDSDEKKILESLTSFSLQRTF